MKTLSATDSQLSTLNSQLRLTFLGTGTSQGVPMIRCDCAVCRSSDPRDNRTRASIFLETAEGNYVVDTGTDFRTQCLRENIWQVDAVIMTHSHTDHVMGFDDLSRFAAPRGGRMPVYASAETMADLARVYEFAFKATNPWPGLLETGAAHHFRCFFVRRNNHHSPPRTPRQLGNLRLSFRPPRPQTDRLSERLQRRARSTSRVRSKSVQLLVIDALRHKPHPTHLSIAQALEVAERVQPARTLFTHICHELPQSAESELPAKVGLAYDGLKIDFPL